MHRFPVGVELVVGHVGALTEEEGDLDVRLVVGLGLVWRIHFCCGRRRAAVNNKGWKRRDWRARQSDLESRIMPSSRDVLSK